MRNRINSPRGADTLAHQYQDTRTSMDVSIGPWRAFIDRLTMNTVGWGPARGQRSREGAVRELPSLPFSRLFDSQSEVEPLAMVQRAVFDPQCNIISGQAMVANAPGTLGTLA